MSFLLDAVTLRQRASKNRRARSLLGGSRPALCRHTLGEVCSSSAGRVLDPTRPFVYVCTSDRMDRALIRLIYLSYCNTTTRLQLDVLCLIRKLPNHGHDHAHACGADGRAASDMHVEMFGTSSECHNMRAAGGRYSCRRKQVAKLGMHPEEGLFSRKRALRVRAKQCDMRRQARMRSRGRVACSRRGCLIRQVAK